MEIEEANMKKHVACRLKVTPAVMEAGGRFGPLFVRLLRGTFRDSQRITAAYQTLTATVARANANIITKAAALWAG